MTTLRIAVVLGTRPEVIKLAPVIRELQRSGNRNAVRVVVTAQHRDMLDAMLDRFDLQADRDLDAMRPAQGLAELTARILSGLAPVYEQERPDLVVVQGDTTTTFAASLAAFYQGIPLAHVEAGLRTGNLADPFPEEANRRMVTVLAAIHLAPTQGARQALRAEGVAAERIVVTGNTVVDALAILRPSAADVASVEALDLETHRLVLVTSHRRETQGQGLVSICGAVRDLVDQVQDVVVVFPVHPNPRVREIVFDRLAGVERVHLREPLDYPAFMAFLARCHLVMSDSGGIVEEAPSFGKPVLILRSTTERPEAIDAGIAKLVGTSRKRIARAARALLEDPSQYRTMSRGTNPYGDGLAAQRIGEVLRRWREGTYPLLPDARQFLPGNAVRKREMV